MGEKWDAFLSCESRGLTLPVVKSILKRYTPVRLLDGLNQRQVTGKCPLKIVKLK